VGNAAEIVSWSDAGVVLPTDMGFRGYSRVRIEESAKMLEELYDNPSQREAMGNAGFEAWQERFTWGKIAKQYEELYLKLLAER
jgi:glycosyltransferase involved in cell wall biosynthesis